MLYHSTVACVAVTCVEELYRLLQGQLGCDATAENYTPERVPVPENVVGIAAGHYHSLAWTSEGQLYSWG